MKSRYRSEIIYASELSTAPVFWNSMIKLIWKLVDDTLIVKIQREERWYIRQSTLIYDFSTEN